MIKEYIRVVNFEKFQHYKDRTPPWIKLYNDILDDYEFSCLQDASKLHLVLIWLLASRTDNRIPADSGWIERKISATENVNLDELIKAGFLEKIIEKQELQTQEQDDSKPIAKRKQDDCLEREEETEGEEEKQGSKNKFSDDDFSLAQQMFSDLKTINAEHKQPNLEKWAVTIRLMRERDNRTHAEISSVWSWANKHNFWQSNILSPGKLREKWDQLILQKGRKPEQPKGKLARAAQAMEEYYAQENNSGTALQDAGSTVRLFPGSGRTAEGD